jgi:hypothetical protein
VAVSSCNSYDNDNDRDKQNTREAALLWLQSFEEERNETKRNETKRSEMYVAMGGREGKCVGGVYEKERRRHEWGEGAKKDAAATIGVPATCLRRENERMT